MQRFWNRITQNDILRKFYPNNKNAIIFHLLFYRMTARNKADEQTEITMSEYRNSILKTKRMKKIKFGKKSTWF